jgi:acetyl-CoA carboxylase, biotin carboxylase subunit
MFRRIMVANRGEIARRIIKTLNKLNVESVAVYSEADKEAIYLSEATKKICIGPALALHSYLCEEAILEAALQTECEAIHPGFGFLAENARFAARCNQQKLTFIGPCAKLISLMGDKAKARQIMTDLSVPTLGGSKDIVLSVEMAKDIALKIGYPVLLKARAGGGGKGMRLVESESQLKDAYQDAQREAQSAFGDNELYVEKFIKNARHIEFQILGDHYGNIVCVGERECSVQRKNQKLIEEAPANGFSDETRKQMSDILCRALKNIGYTNAGTVEFLMDKNEQLYFMEMNTRIQVEHPVTELVYGLDLIELQIRIALKEKLKFLNSDIVPQGAAIECRINAEDPANDFLPCPGKIKEFLLPKHGAREKIRIDTHVEKGYVVTPYYDSMLAKVIVHGKDRKEAIKLMQKALGAMRIDGIHTTIDFHQAILRHKDFIDGNYDCSFIEQHLPSFLSQLG